MGSPRALLEDRECSAVSWGDGNIPGFLCSYGADPRTLVVHGEDSKMPCTDVDCSTLFFFLIGNFSHPLGPKVLRSLVPMVTILESFVKDTKSLS